MIVQNFICLSGLFIISTLACFKADVTSRQHTLGPMRTHCGVNYLGIQKACIKQGEECTTDFADNGQVRWQAICKLSDVTLKVWRYDGSGYGRSYSGSTACEWIDESIGGLNSQTYECTTEIEEDC